MKWFVYHAETGTDFYETEAEAREACETMIELDRDDCDPGWPECVTSGCYGKVFGRVEQVSSGKYDDCEEYPKGHDRHLGWVDYGVVPQRLTPSDALAETEANDD